MIVDIHNSCVFYEGPSAWYLRVVIRKFSLSKINRFDPLRMLSIDKVNVLFVNIS